MTRDHSHAVVSVTVDMVIFTVSGDQLQVLLVKRANEPYRGQLALPGGYLRQDETLDEAALRELREETSLEGAPLHLEQLRSYSDPERDPRGRVITTAYLALGADLPAPVAGTDAQEAHWVPVHNALCESTLAFDHAVILREGLERARAKLEYTSVATVFCAEPFTLSELRRVYEVIWGLRIDPSNFRRKLTRAEGLLESTGAFRAATTGRPAALYRRGPATLLIPPFLRAHNDSSQPWAESGGVQMGQVP